MRKKIIDVHVGDYVIGSNGKPEKVIDETGAFLPATMYRISFTNGTVNCCGQHKWKLCLKNGCEVRCETDELFEHLNRYKEYEVGTLGSNIYIQDIVRIAPRLVKCITVDDDDHQFTIFTK